MKAKEKKNVFRLFMDGQLYVGYPFKDRFILFDSKEYDDAMSHPIVNTAGRPRLKDKSPCTPKESSNEHTPFLVPIPLPQKPPSDYLANSPITMSPVCTKTMDLQAHLLKEKFKNYNVNASTQESTTAPVVLDSYDVGTLPEYNQEDIFGEECSDDELNLNCLLEIFQDDI